jgi:pimeloyl-ACP methyl ester carboxylesterase
VSRWERFTSQDGTSIACHVVGEGPPLVLVHGTTADHTRWVRIVEELSSRFTTYAVDRRGRGQSGDGDEYALELEFADIAAVIDGIGGDVDVLGHSYGAACSLEASLRTSHIRRLVLYEPPLPIGIPLYPDGLADKLEGLLRAGDRAGVVAEFMLEVARLSAADLAVVQSLPSWPARVDAAHTIPREMRIADGYKPDFERFGSLGIPTLLLVGAESEPFLVEPSRRLHALISGSRLVTMAGQGHVAMDTDPELFLREVTGFLD